MMMEAGSQGMPAAGCQQKLAGVKEGFSLRAFRVGPA